MVRAMKKNKCGKEISALSCKEIRKASQMRYFEQRPEWRKTVSPVTLRGWMFHGKGTGKQEKVFLVVSDQHRGHTPEVDRLA